MMARPHHKLTPEDVEHIVHLREEFGTRLRDLAAVFDVSIGTIAYHLTKFGVVGPSDPRPREPGKDHLRAGVPARFFRPEEDDRILALRAAEVGFTEIAGILDRDPPTVRRRLSVLAHHQALAEHERIRIAR